MTERSPLSHAALRSLEVDVPTDRETDVDFIAGPPPDPVDASEHLTTALWRRADDPAEALRFHDGHGWVSLSWQELAHRVREVAAGLIALGIEPGDPVAIMSPTRPEWTIADLAILAAAGVTVPVYETASQERCAWVLRNTSARLVLAGSRELAERIDGVRDEVEGLEQILVFDEGALDELAAGAHDDARAALDRRLAALRGDAVASIVHTSGTTGQPKGCVLTHHHLVWTTRQSLRAVEVAFRGERPSTLLYLPLAHVFARIIQFAGLEAGALIGYARSRDQLPEDLQAVRPRFLLGVPRVFEKVAEAMGEQATSHLARRVVELAEQAAGELAQDPSPGLTTRVKAMIAEVLVYRRVRAALGGEVRYALSGGGPLSDDVVHLLAAAGMTIVQGYGLTETSAPATIDRPDAPRVGTVGRPIPGVEVRIDDHGEVLVRGPNVFAGYHRDEQATAEAISEDGWLRTGDLGELDEDGCLRITGRTKALIVTAGGKNVAPEPLEESLRAHPLIAHPVVIGDGRPFVAALIAIDPDAAERFAEQRGDADPAARHQDPGVLEEISEAVEVANRQVSRAEAIRDFRILERPLLVAHDELTPTHKPRRSTVVEHFAEVVDDIYQDRAGDDTR